MSVHQKPNGTWFVQYRVPGEKYPKREYCGVGDAGEQRARIRDAEVRLAKARGDSIRRDDDRVYLDTVVQAYITERKMRGASATWLRLMTSLLNETILPALTDKPVDAFTYPEIIAFIEKAWGEKSLSTRQSYTAYLKALFKFGIEHELTKNHPLAKWRKTKEKKRDMLLTVANLQKILANASPELAWAIEVEWEIGARPGPSELFALRWSDVDFQRCMLHIRGTKTATSDRIIPITEHFRDRLLQKRKEAQSEYVVEYKGGPVKGMFKGLKRAAERAGLAYSVRLYDIRHLFASIMITGGGDLAAVSRLLGHAQIATTQGTYYHLQKDEMARATKKRPKLKPQKEGIQKGIQGKQIQAKKPKN